MQVPQLQFAQVPVMQLPNEMQGFSNALLQAGQMRQQRLAQQEALARQMEQQQFENQMAQQRMDMEQKRFGMDEQRFGLEQQRFGMEQKREEDESKIRAAGLEKLERDANLRNIVSQLGPQLQGKPASQAGQAILEAYLASGQVDPDVVRQMQADIVQAKEAEFKQTLPTEIGGQLYSRDGTVKEVPLTAAQRMDFSLRQQQMGMAQRNAANEAQANMTKLLSSGLEKHMGIAKDNVATFEGAAKRYEDNIMSLDDKISKAEAIANSPESVQSELANLASNGIVLNLGADPTNKKDISKLYVEALTKRRAEEQQKLDRARAQAYNSATQFNGLNAAHQKVTGLQTGIELEPSWRPSTFGLGDLLSQDIQSGFENLIKQGQTAMAYQRAGDIKKQGETMDRIMAPVERAKKTPKSNNFSGGIYVPVRER